MQRRPVKMPCKNAIFCVSTTRLCNTTLPNMKNMKPIYHIINILMITSLLSCNNKYISPVDAVIDSDKNIMVVADYTSSDLKIFDLISNKVTGKIDVGSPLKAICIDKNSGTVYGATFEPVSRIFRINRGSKLINWIGKAGHSVSDIKFKNNSLYIVNHFNNSVSVFDIESGDVVKNIYTGREPIALNIVNNKIWVANHLPDNYSSTVMCIDPKSGKTVKEVLLPYGSTILKDIVVSPDNKNIIVPHLLGHIQYPTNQIERGWIYNNCISVIDVETYSVKTIILDDLDLGAANPQSVSFTKDGETLFVSHFGSNEISVIDYPKLIKKISDKESGYISDFTTIVNIRKRVKLNQSGVGIILPKEKNLYALGYYSGDVSKTSLNDFTSNYYSLGKQKEADDIRKGEIAFHSAEYCFQQWQTCASCHPGDARVDALNWDLMNDGIGNPKNTKNMLYAHSTPPSMSTGIRPSAKIAVRAGFKHIFFKKTSEEVAATVDKYLMSLRHVPSPYLVNGKLSENAKKGKEIFVKSQCAHCHSGDFYTNMKSYNMGTGLGRHKNTKFDTPTLIELWRTAPYLHDGRANTVEEVLIEFNESGKHGNTSELSKEEINSLKEYLLSL